MLKNNKIVKILLSVIVFLAFLIGVFIYLIKWNSSYVAPQTKVSPQLIDKIRIAQTQGGTIELESSELNQIIGMYFRGEKKSASLTVKGIRTEVSGEKIILNIPSNYKGINIFISSQGTLSLKDNKIVYSPEKFTVGKITLPKDYVLNKMKSKNIKGFAVENNAMCFDKSSIAINIKAIDIKNDKISLIIEKTINSLEEKLKSLDKKIEKNSIKEKEEQNSKKEITSNKQSNDNKNSTKTKEQLSEQDAALNRITSGLNSAIGSVSSGGQKAVVSEMISAASNMKGNPNANPYESAGSVRDAYKNLSPQEKAELKSVVLSNVDGGDVNIISKMLQ